MKKSELARLCDIHGISTSQKDGSLCPSMKALESFAKEYAFLSVDDSQLALQLANVDRILNGLPKIAKLDEIEKPQYYVNRAMILRRELWTP